jgi:hypothetical protein
MLANTTYVCDLSFVFQFVNVYSSSVFLHWCWCFSSWLTMEESKSQSNVKYCAESAVIHYIFNYIIQKNSVCSLY